MQRFEEVYDKLIRWYREGGVEKLPEDLQVHRLRWIAIRDYLIQHKPSNDGIVASHFGVEWRLSDATMYHEIRSAKRFYAYCEPAVKEFDKIVLIAQIKELRALALRKPDLKTAAKCDENLIRLGAYDDPAQEGAGAAGTIETVMQFNPGLVGATRHPNLLAQVEKFIGEKARRELLIDAGDWIQDVDHEDLPPSGAANPDQP